MGFLLFLNMQNIEENREKIYSLLGKHLIDCQTIEMRLKALLKMNKTIITKPNDKPITIEPSVKNQTLGGLSTTALTSLFLLNEPKEEVAIGETTNGFRMDIKLAFNLCEHSHQKLNTQLQEFVADRNFITHHFQEQYDLSKPDDCTDAINYLLNIEKKHKPFLDQFEQYCLSAKKSLDTQIDFLKSNLFKARLLFPIDEIYKAIELLILNNRKNDGWISLTTISSEITKNFLNVNQKIKAEYGFKNLNDLILNTGLFLLKIEPTSKGEKILIQLNHGETTFEIIEN